MPKTEEILVPDIGDFDAVEIVEVLVNPGDAVEVEDPLITLESDKATMEVPSTLAGKVVEVKVKVGDKVGEGAVILILETEDAAAAIEESGPAPEESESQPAEPAEPAEPRRRGLALAHRDRRRHASSAAEFSRCEAYPTSCLTWISTENARWSVAAARA